jgi:putative FmdB family regulatory protein
MPIYEYQCKDCDEVFEKMVPFSKADQPPACPKCESKETHKKISTIASLGVSSAGSNHPTSSSCNSRSGFS